MNAQLEDPSARDAVATALRVCIENISEDYWRAGWYSGIEFALWEHLIGEREKSMYAAVDLAPLMPLAELAGCWWRWNGECERVPLDEWRSHWREWRDAPRGEILAW